MPLFTRRAKHPGAPAVTCPTCGATRRPNPAPEGHLTEIIEFQSGPALFHLARCQCGWTERVSSYDAAEGAITGHLRSAQPHARWDAAAFAELQAAEVARRFGQTQESSLPG